MSGSMHMMRATDTADRPTGWRGRPNLPSGIESAARRWEQSALLGTGRPSPSDPPTAPLGAERTAVVSRRMRPSPVRGDAHPVAG